MSEQYNYFLEIPPICSYFIQKLRVQLDKICQTRKMSVSVQLSTQCYPVVRCRVVEFPTSKLILTPQDFVVESTRLKKYFNKKRFIKDVAWQLYSDLDSRRNSIMQIYFTSVSLCPKSGTPGILFYWRVLK